MSDAIADRIDALIGAAGPEEMLSVLSHEVPDSVTGMKGFAGNSDFAVGSVLGYRCWKMPVDNLQSLTGAYGCTWDTRTVTDDTFTASCRRNDLARLTRPGHAAPEPSCGCGFWAYWDFPRTHSVNVGGISWVRVHGVLEGFGTVLIGEKGFRAGKARIRGLAIDHEYYRNELRSEYAMRFRNSSPGIHRSRFKTEQGAALAEEMCRAYHPAHYPVQEPAFPENAFMSVVAMLESRLEFMYPTARIFSTSDSLRKYFGADASYGTTVRRHPELASRGVAWLYFAMDALHAIRSTIHRHCGANGLHLQLSSANDEVCKLLSIIRNVREELESRVVTEG